MDTSGYRRVRRDPRGPKVNYMIDPAEKHVAQAEAKLKKIYDQLENKDTSEQALNLVADDSKPVDTLTQIEPTEIQASETEINQGKEPGFEVVDPKLLENIQPAEQKEVAEQAKQPEDDGKDYEQMYKTLNGKYKAEVQQVNIQSKLNAERATKAEANAKALYEHAQKLEAEVDRLSNEVASLQPDPVKMLDLDPEDPMATYLRQQNEKIKELSNQQSNHNKQSVKDMYQDTGTISHDDAFKMVVDSLGGDQAFNKIDGDPEFNTWLGETLEGGFTRRDLMNQRFANRELGKVIDFYNSWSLSKAQAGAQQPSAQAPSSPREDPRQQFIAPGASKATQPSAPQKKMWTRAEMRDVQHKMSRKEYSEAEAERLTKDMTLAYSEGRIIG